jgi:acetoin utilization deacetylase AcuC-like enzyme
MTRQVLDVAHKYSAGRLVSALEGGYHPHALADSVLAHFCELDSA